MRNLLRVTVAIGIPIAVGCHRGAIRESERPIPIPKGVLLVLPPRDMIQDGKFHRISPGSGKYLLAQIQRAFTKEGWTVVTTDAPEFSNTETPDVRPVVLEGRRLHSDYVLRLVLGEFRDAAPMTFRPDFVTIQSADLWSTKNAALVWSLPQQMEESGNNLRSYHRLMDELAEMLAAEMEGAEVDARIFAKEDQLPPETKAPPRGIGPCTVEQILAMKNTGMTDEQVKRACGN